MQDLFSPYSDETAKLAKLTAVPRAPKGTTNKPSRAEDGGSPWACIPEELREPATSLYGKDFLKPGAVPELQDHAEDYGVPQHVIERLRTQQQRRDAAVERQRERERATKARIAEHDGHLQSFLRDANVRAGTHGTVKVFSHRGIERRSESAPLPDEVLLDKARRDAAAMVEVAKAIDRPLPMTPQRRQRQRFEALEAQRLAAGKGEMLEHGWGPATTAAGPAKRDVTAQITAGLDEAEKARIERQIEEHLASTALGATERRNLRAQRIADAEVPTSPPRHSKPTTMEEVRPEDREAAEEIHRVLARPARSYKPVLTYRPELPGGPTPDDVDLNELPKLQPRPLRRRTTITPEPGKPVTAQVRVARELRLVRDRGLQRQPRVKASARLTAAQKEFIMSVPTTGPLVGQGVASLPRASLR